VSQNLQLTKLLGETAFYIWCHAVIGLLLAVLIRNLVGAIVVVFVAPTVEQLLGLLLKHNVNYLPFTAVQNVLAVGQKATPGFSVGKSVAIVLGYLVVGWIVAWILFLKRDAN
jgi:ABC-type transport system involved in multi-copper enzyme maturation permease subunit